MKKLSAIIPVLALFLSACVFSRAVWSVIKSDSSSTDSENTIPAPIPSETKGAPTPGAGAESTPVSPMLDVPYSNFSSVDPNLTSLDIYPPSTGANHPILIFVHGGGWSRGDKKYVDAKPEAFNQAGYVFVSVNYRLLPEADIPTQAGDVAQAISWVHEHAASFRGDAEHLFLMGHSAGAHLVSLVSTGSSYLERAGLSLDAITGVVALDTQTYDIPLLMSHNPQAGDLLYRLAFRSDEAFWREVSPIYHVEALCGVPPFIVAYSGQGEGRPEQAERFVQKLKEAGVYSEILPALDKTHLEINQEFGQPDDEVTRAVFTFLSKVLQSTP